MKRIFIFLCVFSLLIHTQITIAETHSTRDGCRDGRAQARQTVSASGWFWFGCLTNVIAFIAAQQEVELPIRILIGKEADYVEAFTQCYKEEGKEIRQRNALNGCLVGTSIPVILFAVYRIADTQWIE